MPRKPKELTKAQIKAIADRAEGIAPDDGDDRQQGRPTDYRSDYARQAEKLCEFGATDLEIADFFGVSGRTIYRWQLKYPEFCQALTSGKKHADERVVRAMYHKAIGYTFETEKVFQYQGEIVRAKTMEHVPPDTIAGKFWLVNRQGGQWREVQRIEHGAPGDFDAMDDGQLKASLVEEAAKLGLTIPGFKSNGKVH